MSFGITPKCKEKAKLCFMNTGNFIVYIKTEEISADIAKDIERHCKSYYHHSG